MPRTLHTHTTHAHARTRHTHAHDTRTRANARMHAHWRERRRLRSLWRRRRWTGSSSGRRSSSFSSRSERSSHLTPGPNLPLRSAPFGARLSFAAVRALSAFQPARAAQPLPLFVRSHPWVIRVAFRSPPPPPAARTDTRALSGRSGRTRTLRASACSREYAQYPPGSSLTVAEGSEPRLPGSLDTRWHRR